jgi:hypothetical protein
MTTRRPLGRSVEEGADLRCGAADLLPWCDTLALDARSRDEQLLDAHDLELLRERAARPDPQPSQDTGD